MKQFEEISKEWPDVARAIVKVIEYESGMHKTVASLRKELEEAKKAVSVLMESVKFHSKDGRPITGAEAKAIVYDTGIIVMNEKNNELRKELEEAMDALKPFTNGKTFSFDMKYFVKAKAVYEAISRNKS